MNNTSEQIERFEWMRLGWKRRSKLLLDAAGCPMWLLDRRCPRMELPDGMCLGDLLYIMTEIMSGRIWLSDE